MELQQLYSKVRQAIDAYQMIKEGDKVALGISGGKDSLSLLYALAGLRSFYPKHFELVAITVDLGFPGFELGEIHALCQKLDVPYEIVHTQIGEISADKGCSLCARLRKGALHDRAKELGCQVIAYAHNMDDVVETMMLSLIYEGRFATFWPVTYLSRSNLRLIRPFVYTTQSEALSFRYKYDLPVVENPCPYDKTSERSYIRQLLCDLNAHTPHVRKRLMAAITDGTIKEWLPIPKESEEQLSSGPSALT